MERKKISEVTKFFFDEYNTFRICPKCTTRVTQGSGYWERVRRMGYCGTCGCPAEQWNKEVGRHVRRRTYTSYRNRRSPLMGMLFGTWGRKRIEVSIDQIFQIRGHRLPWIICKKPMEHRLQNLVAECDCPKWSCDCPKW